MWGMSRKGMAVIVSSILVISAISGFFILKAVLDDRADVPEWEVGDSWRFVVSQGESRSNDSEDYAYDVSVWSNNSFGDEEFYEMSGYPSMFLSDDVISKKDLRPIELVDYEHKTFNRTGRELDFPLYSGKRWSHEYEGVEYNYSVERVSNITVPAGTFDGFKITKMEGNRTESVSYYSPEVEFIFLKFIGINNVGGNISIKLHSYGNFERERKLATQELNNKYHARLETWEVKYFHDWMTEYRLYYTKDGQEFMCQFQEPEKTFLDNLINYTNEDDKILCWWDSGHMIRGYTGREVIIDGPSEKLWDTVRPWHIQNWNDDADVTDVSKALTGSPEETMDIMDRYNATLVYVGPRDYVISPNQQGVYSPIVKGANREPDDYYEVMAVLQNGGSVSLDEAATGFYWWDGYSVAISYKEPYYNSMIYRARFGYCGADIGKEEGTGNPGLSEEMPSDPIMPAWNLANFKVIYRTAYWNPYPPGEIQNHTDAWTELDYWDAYNKNEAGNGMSDLSDRSNLYQGKIILRYGTEANVTGKVVDSGGKPVSGVCVTVADGYGIPHDSTMSDPNGKFALKTPNGNSSIVLSISEDWIDPIIMIGYEIKRIDLNISGNIELGSVEVLLIN